MTPAHPGHPRPAQEIPRRGGAARDRSRRSLPQELVFVIGPSGSGKSTLLRCCNRLEEPSAGSIRVDGVDVMARSTDINAMRRQIGMVFQSFNLYPHMTALRQRHARARQGAGQVARRGRAHRHGGARSRGPRRQGARLSGRAFGRPAAARRDRARARARTEGDAVRRADLGARSGARRQRAQRHARAQARRHDHAGGEPRDALCARCRRPRDLHGSRG